MSQGNPSEAEINTYATAWIGNGNKIKEAWKVTFPDSKATEKSKDEKSSVFHKLAKIQSRILELTNIAAQKADEVYGVTAEQLVGMLLETRGKAMDDGQYGPSVSAVTGISKMCGFDVSKLELTGKGGEAIKTESTFNFIPVGPKD